MRARADRAGVRGGLRLKRKHGLAHSCVVREVRRDDCHEREDVRGVGKAREQEPGLA